VRTPSFRRFPRSPRSAAEGIGVPSIVHPIHVDNPVGGIVGVGNDGGAGQGASLDGATACPTKHSGGGVRPAKRSEDGIAYGVVAVGEGLAGGIVGAGQAVEFIPFAALQGGSPASHLRCAAGATVALVGIYDGAVTTVLTRTLRTPAPPQYPIRGTQAKITQMHDGSARIRAISGACVRCNPQKQRVGLRPYPPYELRHN
jgi:hypothetical protein